MKQIFSLLRFLKPYKRWAIMAPVLIILEVIMDLLLPNIVANIVNIGIANRDASNIIWNITLMILLTIIGVIGGVGSTYYAAKSSQYAASDMRTSLFEKINKLSFFQMDQVKPGHLITVLTNDITLIGNIFMMSLRIIFRVPIMFLGSIIMAILISPKLSLLLIILIPIMLFIVSIIMKRAFPKFQKMQEAVDDVNSRVRENLGGIRVVKAFVREEHEQHCFEQVNLQLKNISIQAITIMTFLMPSIMLLMNVGTIAVLWFGGIDVMNSVMPIGNIMAFIQYLMNILSSLLMASMVFMMLSRSEVSAERINQVFAYQEDFKTIENPYLPEKIKGEVEFLNVSFSYASGSGDLVLKNINLTAKPGEIIAIIGATGSGKSTLIQLLPRFYEVTSGSILIDGIDIKEYDLSMLRSNIGYASQQSILFSGTLEENIKYGVDATLDEVQKIARISGADFIEKKEEKYQFLVEQRGTNLSGGQKQRVAIARALIKNPSILILDDTMSALDNKTEKAVRTRLKKQYQNTTIFLVAQRIGSVMDADKIVVMDDGEIVGIGTHDSLLKENEVYQEIYQSQMKGDE